MGEYKRSAIIFAKEVYEDFLADCLGENCKQRSIDESIKEIESLVKNIDKIKIILPSLWLKEYTFYMLALDYLHKLKQWDK